MLLVHVTLELPQRLLTCDLSLATYDLRLLAILKSHVAAHIVRERPLKPRK